MKVIAWFTVRVESDREKGGTEPANDMPRIIRELPYATTIHFVQI